MKIEMSKNAVLSALGLLYVGICESEKNKHIFGGTNMVAVIDSLMSDYTSAMVSIECELTQQEILKVQNEFLVVTDDYLFISELRKKMECFMKPNNDTPYGC